MVNLDEFGELVPLWSWFYTYCCLLTESNTKPTTLVSAGAVLALGQHQSCIPLDDMAAGAYENTCQVHTGKEWQSQDSKCAHWSMNQPHYMLSDRCTSQWTRNERSTFLLVPRHLLRVSKCLKHKVLWSSLPPLPRLQQPPAQPQCPTHADLPWWSCGHHPHHSRRGPSPGTSWLIYLIRLSVETCCLGLEHESVLRHPQSKGQTLRQGHNFDTWNMLWISLALEPVNPFKSCN